MGEISKCVCLFGILFASSACNRATFDGTISGAITAVRSKLESSWGQAKFTVSSSTLALPTRPTGLGEIWTSGSFSSLTGTGGISPKSWVAQLLNPDFSKNPAIGQTFYGRFKSQTALACALEIALTSKDAQGLPADGSYTPSIDLSDSLLRSKCNLTSADTGKFSPKVEVSTPTDQAIYSKKFVITGDSINPTTLFVKVARDSIQLAYLEDQTASGRAQVTRSITRYHAGLFLFEYISQGFATGTSYEFYRLIIDESRIIGESRGQALFVGNVGSFNNGSTVRLALTALSSSSTRGALSVNYKGQPSGDGTGDYNGCVNPSTGEITVDGTLNCEVTGSSVSDASAIEEHRKKHSGVTSYVLDATTQIPFDDAAKLLSASSAS